MQFLRFQELPAGINAVVAIACYSGYNQEDSLILNQGSIDRGFFRSLFYRCYTDEEKVVDRNSRERICKPDKEKTKMMRFAVYDKLDVDGMIKASLPSACLACPVLPLSCLSVAPVVGFVPNP